MHAFPSIFVLFEFVQMLYRLPLLWNCFKCE